MREVDKQTYKDQYHFTYRYPGVSGEDNPSINIDPKINTTIKKNSERSNVEIEKDEVVMEPDFTALFKARGKKHKNGGIDVSLKPNSFIFSDDPTLHFTEKEQDLFEFKKGGTFTKEKSTPADILKRNIDIKHYNTMVSNLSDLKKDDITKRSSALMLQKYIETIGNVAFLQEQKKNFPDGVPDFSLGTAPIYDSEVKEDVMEQKQYMRYGGRTLPKAQLGKLLNPISNYQNDNENEQPFQYNGAWVIRKNGKLILVPPPINKPPYSTVDPSNRYKVPSNINEQRLALNENATTDANGEPIKFSEVPGRKRYSGVEPLGSPKLPFPFKPPMTIDAPDEILPPTTKINVDNSSDVNVPDVNGPQDNGYNPNWDFSSFQRESQGYNAYKLASAKRYMPYRSRMNSTFMDPYLVNPEQAIGDVQSATNQQLSAVNTLNPILRNAQASSAFGQYIDKIPGIRTQYDNQNQEIVNRTRSANTSIKNQETAQNMQNDQQYYQQSVVGQQNYDTLKTFLGDQYMNNRMQDVQDNQSLAYTLLQQEDPAYIYDYRTGQFKPNPKRNILNVKGNQKGDYLQNFLDQLDKAPISAEKKWELKSKIATGRYLSDLSK